MNARMYDPILGEFTSVDPLADKYPGWGPYVYCVNNPLVYWDPTGEDVVYFGEDGDEITRIISEERFETYVQVEDGAKGSVACEVSPVEGAFMLAEMPNVIEEKNGVSTIDPKYQQNDYQIAAQTFLFNKNKDNIQLYTDGNRPIPMENNCAIPRLDPTVVKAIAMQESTCGNDPKRQTDILSANAKGDWGSFKGNYGLTKDAVPNVAESLRAGIQILATKGFKGGGSSYVWEKGTSWIDAANNFNGGGTVGYKSAISTMVSNSFPGVKINYK